MFFENNDVSIVDPNITLEELREYAEKRNFPFHDDEVASHWNAYAHKYGAENGLSFSERLSFAYICSSIIGGRPYSCSTEAYYKEERIAFTCIDALNQLRDDETLSEEDVLRALFEFIFLLYLKRIEEFTFKTEKMNFKVSLSMMEHYEEVEGDTRAEKFRNLVQFYRFNK